MNRFEYVFKLDESATHPDDLIVNADKICEDIYVRFIEHVEQNPFSRISGDNYTVLELLKLSVLKNFRTLAESSILTNAINNGRKKFSLKGRVSATHDFVFKPEDLVIDFYAELSNGIRQRHTSYHECKNWILLKHNLDEIVDYAVKNAVNAHYKSLTLL